MKTKKIGAKLVRKMNTNEKVISDLVKSYAWDTAIIFIQEFSGDVDYSKQIKIQTRLAKTGQATDGKEQKGKT